MTAAVRIIGHRGARAVAPENTRAGLRRGLADGADGLEFDVRALGDGRPVLLHDATVDRTTDGCGPLAWHDAASVARLDAGRGFGAEYAGERVPFLEDVLDELLGRTTLAIEMKEVLPPASLDVVVAARRERPDAPMIVASFLPGALAAARLRLPDVPRALILPVGQGLPPPTLAGAADLWGVFAPDADVDAALVEEARRRGLTLWVYTVNDPARAASLAALGVEAIITDDPARIRTTLRSGG